MTLRMLLLAPVAALVLATGQPTPAAHGQPALPDTPAARQFGAWLEAFNSADRARLQQFLEQHRTEGAKSLERDLQFREMTGGLTLKKVEEATATRFVALVQDRKSDQFGRLELEVEAAPPHRIAMIGVRAVPRPSDFPLPRVSEAEALQQLRTKIDEDVAADAFAGAVAVAKNGQTIFSGAYGLADREKKIPNTVDTRFRIGSMNKMFTGVAILQLVQAGKIKLTDPLGVYLTDYPNKTVASKVTIHQLLTHTGGTGDIFGPDFTSHRTTLRTLADYLGLYGARDLKFEPGSRWEYSNYGFLLLGAIVERVSGTSYYDYVRDHVYTPAGMTSTGSEPEDAAVPNRAIGYTKMGGGNGWHPNTGTLPYRGTSAGGGYSTVGDLVRFANALLAHKLLDAQHTTLLMTGKVDVPQRGGKYAYGFTDTTVDGLRTVGHGGGAPGMNGELIILPVTGYAIAALANLDPPSAGRIAQFVSARLPK